MGVRARGFSVVEVLVVVAVIALLVAIALPSLGRARAHTSAAVCQSNMRQIAVGWTVYADEHRDVLAPHRAPQSGPSGAASNWFNVGSGAKHRPRWLAIIGPYVGEPAYNAPTGYPVVDDRQDYDGKVYRCPAAPLWVDSRNHAYGYNYQFLGNARTRDDGSLRNFPVRRAALPRADQTVVAADSAGTAGGVSARDRRAYRNNGVDFAEWGNHAYTLDPPRITAASDRGSGDPCTPTTGPDERHLGRAGVAFGDGHALRMTAFELGYRQLEDGRYVAEETVPDPPHNRLFSGLGIDLDPPDAQ